VALGDVTDIVAGESKQIEILASAIATNGAPSANSGVEINALRIRGEIPVIIRCGCVSTAGSGTMTVALKVWMKTAAGWVVAKSLNGGSNIAETSADSIAYSEDVTVIACSRIYMEIAAIAGTNTAVTGYAWVQG
jgi:hypothetical protein